jgi:predicted metal-dependent peptidase
MVEYYELEEEFERIGMGLERWHGLFAQIWAMGVPRFVEHLNPPTAGVSFNREGRFHEFLFHREFWQELNDYQREFIISHECLHVTLKHGVRYKDCKNKDLGNIALDIVVNRMLCESFGFSRTRLGDLGDELIWLDTVFEDTTGIDPDESFEYYYALLEQKMSGGGGKGNGKGEGKSESSKGEGGQSPGDGGGMPQPIDVHDMLPGFDDDDVKDSIDGMIEDALGQLSNEELDQLQKAGCMPGNGMHIARIFKKRNKRSWEEIIDRWTKKGAETPEEQWTRRNRRHVFLSPEFMLPAEVEDGNSGKKANVWFFQDTSGSCKHMADDFFNSAMTFPTKVFKVRMFGFTTHVYEIDPKKRKLEGFGGTYFHIIEGHIQKICKEEKVAYPDAVFVFTDGCGSNVRPQYPERWYWFLDGRGQTKTYIPSKSQHFKLKDFVE